MTTIEISEEVNTILNSICLFVKENKGLTINQNQAILYLNEAWEDAKTKPEIYYTDIDHPSESIIFYKPYGSIVLSKADFMKPKIIKARKEITLYDNNFS